MVLLNRSLVMINRIKAMKTLFTYLNPESVIENYLDHKAGYYAYELKHVDAYIRGFKGPNMHRYTVDEMHNIINLVCDEWSKDPTGKERNTIFSLIINFANEVLLEQGGLPTVKYEKSFDWRGVTLSLGEDLFSTAYLAKKDFSFKRNRENFDWRPILDMNNPRLREMMKKGVAENHFHLKGSSPHFQLTWISLMNSIENRTNQFKKLEKDGRLTQGRVVGFDEKLESLHLLVIKAACIRLFLSDDWILRTSNKSLLLQIIAAKHISEAQMHLGNLQRRIDVRRYDEGYRFGEYIADYMIAKNYPTNQLKVNKNSDGYEYRYKGNMLLSGERAFLYKYFTKILEGDEDYLEYGDLFYAYVMIKLRLRNEIVQTNQEVGFKNFAQYQDRKTHFLDKDKFLKNAVKNLAGAGSIYDENLKSFEARLGPKDSVDSLIAEIDATDQSMYDLQLSEGVTNEKTDVYLGHNLWQNNMQEDLEQRFFYTLHFIKLQEDKFIKRREKDIERASIKKGKFSQDRISFIINWAIPPRNNEVRASISEQAKVLDSLRKIDHRVSRRILGIDAANFEIGCRPEVFAQIYRFLRYSNYEARYPYLREFKQHNLGRTYHAGEDFIGLVDGLRAIDETIRFLDFTHGDRIGHGLALGINPYEYYSLKHNEIVIKKHDLLDNLAWLIAKSRKYALQSNQVEKLRKLFINYFYEIYVAADDFESFTNVTPEQYYDAWKLRGDAPSRYDLPFEKRRNLDPEREISSKYESHDLSRNPKLNRIRENRVTYNLYHAYHFNDRVRIAGEKETCFKVDLAYIQFIECIQNELMKEVAERNISIECNPSSNYLIGTFKRYDKHPIKRFYNLGLEINPNIIQECPQLSVSINTDDQGVFATYIENEYALMALAMEMTVDDEGNKKYKPSMIYDWLDRIRQMGLEQSFLLRNQ